MWFPRSSAGIVSGSGIVSDDDLVAKAKVGDSVAFNELLDRHHDLLQRKASAFSRAPIPNSVIYGHAIMLMRAAVERYNPSAGVKFRTFLENTVRLTRFTNQHKNVARIPEHRALLIKRYLAAKKILEAERDREPTVTELAEALGWSVSDVSKMEQAVNRRELSSSGMQFDQISEQTDRFKETAEFLYFGLTPEEQLVYDYSLGAHGKRAVRDVKEMSRITHLSTDRIYNIKKKIAKELAQTR